MKSRTQLNSSRYILNSAISAISSWINSANSRQYWNCIKGILFLCPLMTRLIHCAILFPYILRIRSPKFMLLSQVMFSDVILIFQPVHHPCSVFKPTSLTEVTKQILSFPNTSYELDPISTFLQKSCLRTLIFPITKIIKLSLTFFLWNHLYQSMT